MWGDLSYSLSAGRDRTLTSRARRPQDLLENFRRDPPKRWFLKFADFTEGPKRNLIQVLDSQGARVTPWVIKTSYPSSISHLRETSY
jgi:hypothetical protein